MSPNISLQTTKFETNDIVNVIEGTVKMSVPQFDDPKFRDYFL